MSNFENREDLDLLIQELKEGQTSSLSLLQELEAVNPEQDFVITAFQELEDPDGIKQFFKEYLEFLKKNATESIYDPEDLAIGKIQGVAAYCSQEVVDRWFDALPEVSQPTYWKFNN